MASRLDDGSKPAETTKFSLNLGVLVEADVDFLRSTCRTQSCNVLGT